MKIKQLLFSCSLLLICFISEAQDIVVPVEARPIVTVDFGDKLHSWDGFGVTYVQTAQTRDYTEWPQEYGGFSLLSEQEREEVLQLIFGEDGLRPSLTKLFLDCYHEGLTAAANDNDDPLAIREKGFDHTHTAKWALHFNKRGWEITQKRGGRLQMLTTLYGPPPWMTQQGFVLGRDLNPAYNDEFVEYMVSWVDFLVKIEKLPIRYLSLHNEGDAYYRWPADGSNPGEDHRDFNMYWTPEMVTQFIKKTDKRLKATGLDAVGMTPGETQTWYRFDEWGYARALYHDPEALEALSLITSHSFANFRDTESVYYGDYRNNGLRYLREKKPTLNAWVTSMSWGKMDVDFVEAIRRNIYLTGCNGLIPWALIQRPTEWIGGDPNPGTAFHVTEEGEYKILPGYYFYKQVSRAGQAGMAVAAAYSLDPSVSVMGFASNGTPNPDTFVLLNRSDVAKKVALTLKGTSYRKFSLFRTDKQEQYAPVGEIGVEEGEVSYEAPPRSVTTFFGIE